MESAYVNEVGHRGSGRPLGSEMVLPGVGDRNQRTRAARRAVEVMKTRRRSEYEQLFEDELRWILVTEGSDGI